jgi:hypothetical protein
MFDDPSGAGTGLFPVPPSVLDSPARSDFVAPYPSRMRKNPSGLLARSCATARQIGAVDSA